MVMTMNTCHQYEYSEWLTRSDKLGTMMYNKCDEKYEVREYRGNGGGSITIMGYCCQCIFFYVTLKLLHKFIKVCNLTIVNAVADVVLV